MSTTTDILQFLPIDPLTGSIAVPVYQTATFLQEEPGVNKGFDYARSNNPTRKVLEDTLAKLENGIAGFAFATGLAAIDAVLKTLSAGDEVVAVDDIYGGAYRLFTHVYEKLGIKFVYVDTTDSQNVANAITTKTKFVWIESPTNPLLKISDIKKIADLAHQVKALLVVDNTFAGPLHQKPLNLGADIVVHSATKYIGGHSDLVAGAVIVNSPELASQLKFVQNASGGILGPWDCFLTIRGLQTLPLRYERQSNTGLAVAKLLESHAAIEEVFYPGLKGHKNHDTATIQQKRAFGGVVSFSLKNDTREAAKSFIKNLKLFILAESLGGVKSLVCHPATMTHASVPAEIRVTRGIKESLIRLSCGIEDTADILVAIENALTKLTIEKPELA